MTMKGSITTPNWSDSYKSRMLLMEEPKMRSCNEKTYETFKAFAVIDGAEVIERNRKEGREEQILGEYDMIARKRVLGSVAFYEIIDIV